MSTSDFYDDCEPERPDFEALEAMAEDAREARADAARDERMAPLPLLHTPRTAAAEALASARQRRWVTEQLGDALGMPRGALWDPGAITFTAAADYCSRAVVHAYRDDPAGYVTRVWVEAFELLTDRAMRARLVRVERLERAA